jgi:adenylate cyclase class IV
VRGLEVALDEVEGLGSFVEVEGRGDGADVDALRAQVLGLLKEVGGRESLRTSYLEMLLARAPEGSGRGSPQGPR